MTFTSPMKPSRAPRIARPRRRAGARCALAAALLAIGLGGCGRSEDPRKPAPASVASELARATAAIPTPIRVDAKTTLTSARMGAPLTQEFTYEVEPSSAAELDEGFKRMSERAKQVACRLDGPVVREGATMSFTWNVAGKRAKSLSISKADCPS